MEGEEEAHEARLVEVEVGPVAEAATGGRSVATGPPRKIGSDFQTFQMNPTLIQTTFPHLNPVLISWLICWQP